MLLVRCFVDTGLVEPFNPRPYARDWMMHNDGERYLDFVSNLCAIVPTPGLGDLVLFRYGRCYSHGGIVSELAPLRIVHAYFNMKAVIEEDLMLNDDLVAPHRKMTFFSFWRAGE
jgi:hypothetical protein